MPRRVVVGRLCATCIREISDAVHRTTRAVTSRVAGSSAESSSPSSQSRLMEALEDRRLLSVGLSGGVLSVSGVNGQRNTLTVTKNSSGAYVAKANSTSHTYSASSVSSIKVTGGNWNDTIRIDTGITKPTTITGGDGNDYIAGGGGNDSISGGNGNDSLWGNAGNDKLNGDAGNDFIDGGSGTDAISGGSGTNTTKNGESASASAPPSGSASSSTSLSVTAVELWNTDTNQKIQTLNGGETLDLAKLPSHITVVVQGSTAVKSVKFGFDSNSKYRVESAKPWSITGDVNGKLMAWSLSTGGHKITVTPYSKTGATGTAGSAKTISFTVTRTSTGSATPPNTSTGTSGIVPRDNSASAPSAVITAVSSKTIHAGQSFHAHALNSALNDGTPITARYAWDFGDSGSSYNTLIGFNAAHYYDSPGNYTVKLTVTNESGKSSTTSTTVTVQSAGRKLIYVSTSGSDSNDGLSQDRPLRTFDKAAGKLADNTEILFKGGQTFSVSNAMRVYKKNVVIGSYGSGQATLNYTGPKDYTTMIWLGGQGGGEDTVENLIFDSIYTGSAKDGVPQGVGVGGVGDTVFNNEFRNVGYAVNASAAPSGLLIQGNDAPVRSGLKEYFLWSQGDDITVLGNNITNTLFGHDIRSAGTDRLNIAYNTISNPNDPAYGDNVNRGTINIHKGSYAYIANNTFNDGVTSVGPLNLSTGLDDKGARMKWVVFEGNTVNDSIVLLLHGTEHYMARNNIIKQDNTWDFELQGYSSVYGRGIVDASFVNNTGVNNGSIGNFIRVDGPVDGINLINNLYLAPKLGTGTSGSAPVFVYDNDLSSFNKITGNVWPTPTIDKYAEGGINYVWPTWSNQAGYKTPAEWEAYGVVLKDYYEDTSYNSSYAPSTSSQAASASVVWAGVFTDKNGKIRSNSGSWTAGAIEV